MPLDDYSDLRCQIEVLFSSLQFLAPGAEWSWTNPALAGWMQANGIAGTWALSEAHLWVILQSLQAKQVRALAAYRSGSLPSGAAAPQTAASCADG